MNGNERKSAGYNFGAHIFTKVANGDFEVGKIGPEKNFRENCRRSRFRGKKRFGRKIFNNENKKDEGAKSKKMPFSPGGVV
jgi:hypothetical protein